MTFFFEGELSLRKLERRAVLVVETFERDVDIANFISLEPKTNKIIRKSIEYSIPTLLWMFFANTKKVDCCSAERNTIFPKKS